MNEQVQALIILMSPRYPKPSTVLLGRTNWKILIAGLPGSGKSTFLQLLSVTDIRQGEVIGVEDLLHHDWSRNPCCGRVPMIVVFELKLA